MKIKHLSSVRHDKFICITQFSTKKIESALHELNDSVVLFYPFGFEDTE